MDNKQYVVNLEIRWFKHENRGSAHGWTTLTKGDNHVELLRYTIKVNNFEDAVLRASRIAALIGEYEYEEFCYTQINLRAWQVEVTMSAPSGCWWSGAQRRFAKALNQKQ